MSGSRKCVSNAPGKDLWSCGFISSQCSQRTKATKVLEYNDELSKAGSHKPQYHLKNSLLLREKQVREPWVHLF